MNARHEPQFIFLRYSDNFVLSFFLAFLFTLCSQAKETQEVDSISLQQISSVNTSKNTVSMTVHDINGRHFLYTGGSAKEIEVFSVSHQGELEFLKSFELWERKGPTRGLVASKIGDTHYLFVGNKFGNAVEVHRIDQNGMLERVFVQEDTDEMHLGVVITLDVVHLSGIPYLYVGGLEETPGLSSFRIHDDGRLEHIQSTPDDEEIFTDGIIGMSTHTIEGQTYLFTGGFQDSGVSSFRLMEGGGFQNVSNIKDDHTMFLNGTYPVISAQIGKRHFVITGHRHHIYYKNSDFIKKKGFYYHGDGITVFQVNTEGELLPRAVMQGDSRTLIKGQTRLGSLSLDESRTLVAAATRDDESIQLCYLEETGLLTPVYAHHVGFPIYYAMQMARIKGQAFLFAASLKDPRLVSYKIEHP